MSLQRATCIWGYGPNGRLAHGLNVAIDEPKLITSNSLIGKEVVHVSCGSWHTAVVTSQGEFYTWYGYTTLNFCHQFQFILKIIINSLSLSGKGGSGQLGHVNLKNLSFSTFTKVEGFEDQTVLRVRGGMIVSILLS